MFSVNLSFLSPCDSSIFLKLSLWLQLCRSMVIFLVNVVVVDFTRCTILKNMRFSSILNRFAFSSVLCTLLPSSSNSSEPKKMVWLGTNPLPVTWSSTYRHNFIIISLFWGFSGSYYHGSHRLFLVYYKVLSCLCFRFFFCFCFLHFMFSSSLTSWICRTG